MKELANLSNIYLKRNVKRMRESSYDRTGGNDDRYYIQPKEERTIFNVKDCGIITHFWITHANEGFEQEPLSHRKVILRMYWDDETSPSVEAPIGDFFGMGHGVCKNFVSAPLQMSPEHGRSMNSWWPMPFRKGARITITNECDSMFILYFYIDYEIHKELPEETLYFHAQYRRIKETKGHEKDSFKSRTDWLFTGNNTTGIENYIIMEAKGSGHYCGCHINIDNFNNDPNWDWPGEGDDMIFIDDEPWPPRLHGTGTEDYVNMAWCPTQEYNAPYHGLILGGDNNWKNKITYYRYHIQDPIIFTKNIKVTIEHGHNNNRSDDWSTTAYWYQTEPHKKHPSLPKVKDRLPR